MNKNFFHIRIFVNSVLLLKEIRVIKCLLIVKKIAKYGRIFQGLRLRNW
jgi:hypothetical protein